MVFKRYPYQRLYIGEVLKGNEVAGPAGNNFILNDEAIPRVRIVGTIVRLFHDEDASPRHSRAIIDDGSGAISVRAWGPDREPLLQAKQGDILDVIGKARSFNNVLYIAPVLMKVILNPWWELHHRMQLVKARVSQSMQLKGDAMPTAHVSQKTTEEPSEAETGRITIVIKKIVDYLKAHDGESEFDVLPEAIGETDLVIREAIMTLLGNGEIYFPQPNIIKLT